MNSIDWLLKILLDYPNISPTDVSKAKESVNQLIVCQYGAVTPLEYTIRSPRCTFEKVQFMIQVLGATPKYLHLALASSSPIYHFDFNVSHFLHEMGVRYVSFDGYSRHVRNAKNGLYLNEKELVEFVLCYPQYWSTKPDTADLELFVKIAAHRRRAALRARIALVASLKRRIGKDMVCEIVGYMKKRHYVANEEWGWHKPMIEELWRFSH